MFPCNVKISDWGVPYIDFSDVPVTTKERYVRSFIHPTGDGKYHASVSIHENGNTQSVADVFGTLAEAEKFVEDKTR